MSEFILFPDNPNYEINITGDVRNSITRKLISIRYNEKGYKTVDIMQDGKKRMKKIHRILAIIHIPNPENKPEVNHKNGIKDDNRIENLEWSTHQENMAHALKNNMILKGNHCVASKLTDTQVVEIKTIINTSCLSNKSIGDLYSMSAGAIRAIRNGVTWKEVKAK